MGQQETTDTSTSNAPCRIVDVAKRLARNFKVVRSPSRLNDVPGTRFVAYPTMLVNLTTCGILVL